MPAYIALLRAVNVGGQGAVAMPRLQAALTKAGYQEVRTVLNTGNVVLRTDRAGTDLPSEIALALERGLKLRTEVLVRSAPEWTGVVERNPFPQMAREDPSHLLIVFLQRKAAAGGEASLRAAITGRETVKVVGREAYLTYPDGLGRSRVTLPLIEKHLGARGTGRNWNTVQKLGKLSGAL